MSHFFLKNLIFTTSVVIGSFALSSCSDDDNSSGGTGSTVSVTSVFPHGVYKTDDISNITFNANGLVSFISTTDDTEVTFQYFDVTSRANKPYVLMTVTENDEYGLASKYEFKITLNSMGYAANAEETSTDSEGDIEKYNWKFNYNSDGQLTEITRIESDGETETSRMAYNNGNMVSAITTGTESGETLNAKYQYTSTANIGGVMLFYYYGLDVDELEYAYYAGLLGKASKYLVQKSIDNEDGDEELKTFDWRLNDAGLPSSVTIADESYTETINFRW